MAPADGPHRARHRIELGDEVRGTPHGERTPGSRYFPFHTGPWIRDRDYDPGRDPHLTAGDARVVDSATDQYNDAIVDVVGAARRAGGDWVVIQRSGVQFYRPDGVTLRLGPITVDFDRPVRRDTLLTRPPQNVTSGLATLAWADEAVDIVSRPAVLTGRGKRAGYEITPAG
jgi:hypothetical protein